MMTKRHYIYYAVAALVVVLLGLATVLWWPGARPADADEYVACDTALWQPTDTVAVDSVHRLTYEQISADIAHTAGRVGYSWQEAIAEQTYREVALPILVEAVEASWPVRDSLERLYEQVPHIEALLSQYDQITRDVHSRLQAQVAMLPSLEDAYRAGQLTDREYQRLMKQSETEAPAAWQPQMNPR